jgi:hypothetical protein
MIYRLKGTSGSVINQSFPLQGQVTLGAGQDYDIAVDAESGQGLLARIEVLDDAVRLWAEAGSGVTVNGEEVTELDLAGGDELRIGRSRLILQAPGLRPERVLTGQATRSKRTAWPWWLAAALVAGGAAWAWQQGWLAGLLGQ